MSTPTPSPHRIDTDSAPERAVGALAGRCVVVTRAAEQARDLVGLLRAEGATVVEVPMLAIADPADGGAALAEAAASVRAGAFDWVVVTSANGARRLAGALGPGPHPSRFAAVGAATADALARCGIDASLVPATAVGEALVDAFPTGRGRVLLAVAALTRDVVAPGLAAKGWVVERVEAYRTVPADTPSPAARRMVAGADALTCASPSTVRRWGEAALAVPPVVACIGEVTAAAARAVGWPGVVVAPEATAAGLVAAVRSALAGPGLAGHSGLAGDGADGADAGDPDWAEGV